MIAEITLLRPDVFTLILAFIVTGIGCFLAGFMCSECLADRHAKRCSHNLTEEVSRHSDAIVSLQTYAVHHWQQQQGRKPDDDPADYWKKKGDDQ